MLELKNINKKFGSKVIFDNFNLTINAGEVVFLIRVLVILGKPLDLAHGFCDGR